MDNGTNTEMAVGETLVCTAGKRCNRKVSLVSACMHLSILDLHAHSRLHLFYTVQET